jgi:hypothetical protein
LEKQFGNLKKVKQKPSTALLGIYPRKMKVFIHTQPGTPMLTAVFFPRAQTGNNPTQTSINMSVSARTQRNVRCSIAESQNSCVEQRKSDKKEYILEDSINVKF